VSRRQGRRSVLVHEAHAPIRAERVPSDRLRVQIGVDRDQRGCETMPSSIQLVPRPHPVPSSRNDPPGFDATSVRSRDPVSRSEFMVNPTACDRARSTL
jgi:hypothetical protein